MSAGETASCTACMCEFAAKEAVYRSEYGDERPFCGDDCVWKYNAKTIDQPIKQAKLDRLEGRWDD